MVPKSEFILRLTNSRFGKDKNENSWSEPFRPKYVRFIPITLSAWLQ